MSVTVGVNRMSVVHKSSGGVAIAFPDVCRTPVPAHPIPIPYPSAATTANQMQKKAGNKTQLSQRAVLTRGATIRRNSGDEAGSIGSRLASKTMAQAEFTMLKSSLMRQGNNIAELNSDDPNVWQAALQEYAVTASALYMTKLGLK